MKRIITNFLKENNLFPNNDLSLLYYGLKIAFLLFINFISAIIISIMSHTTSVVLFSIFFICIFRRYAGGFHAGNPYTCFILSQFIVAFCSYYTLYIQISFPVKTLILFGAIISSVIIFYKAPVYSKYRPLMDKQIISYRKKARLFCIIYCTICIASYLLTLNKCFKLFSFALMLQCIIVTLPERSHR